MKIKTTIHVLALLAAIAAVSRPAEAQRGASGLQELRSSLERRFEVLPLRDGIALRPREASRDIRSIEITNGPIAIDGTPVTGAELRQRLGADADLVLQISYLSENERRDLIGNTTLGDSSDRLREVERRAAERVTRRIQLRNRGGDDARVRVGRSQSVAEGEVVSGDVVTIGGSTKIDGEVLGDAVTIGGRMTLGPHANVQNDVVVVGGTLERDPEARIGGKVSEVGIGGFNFGDLDWSRAPGRLWWGSRMSSAFELVMTFTRFATLCLLCALVILLGREFVERTASRASVEPLKAGAIGVLAQVLFVPVLIITVVVLAITIIGIPLLFLLVPAALLALIVVFLVGFTSVAYRLGGFVAERFGWAVDNPYARTTLGIVVVMTPILLTRLISLAGGLLFPMTFGLGIIGWLVEYLAWTVGFGAVALARFNRHVAPMAGMTNASV